MQQAKKLSKDKLFKLITQLEIDLPALDDESFQWHEPAYYNYVTYYDELIVKLLSLGIDESKSVYGAYLVGLLAYQVLDLKKSLAEACEMLIDELKTKLKELETARDIDEEIDEDDTNLHHQA